jgi:hypothetical protein
MPLTDNKRVIGGKVHAFACHVTSEAECSRQYGSNKKTKLVNGAVVSVEKRRTATGRANWFIEADYQLGADAASMKRKSLNVRSVRSGPVPVSPVADPSPAAATTEAATTPAVSNVVATSAIGTATFTAPSEGPTATFCATTTATIATTAAMVAAPTNTATRTPVATVHEEEWFHSDTTIKLKEVPFRQCKVKDTFGKDV